MKNSLFLRQIQQRAARVAVGASTTRGQGAGAVAAAREFLAELRLTRFGIRDQRMYSRQLNAATRRLMKRLPKNASSWGLARKVLNIFLRDCLYTIHLNKAYNLKAAERLMEIPLDSITAKQIRSGALELPRWRGVKYLEPDLSVAYQTAALMLARQQGVARVHLDAVWWGGR